MILDTIFYTSLPIPREHNLFTDLLDVIITIPPLVVVLSIVFDNIFMRVLGCIWTIVFFLLPSLVVWIKRSSLKLKTKRRILWIDLFITAVATLIVFLINMTNFLNWVSGENTSSYIKITVIAIPYIVFAIWLVLMVWSLMARRIKK